MNNLWNRSVGPFDEAATQRHRHMGLLDCNGDVNADAVNFLAHLCAGLFFDALCDSYVEMQTVSRICQAFCKSENVEAIWWISGSKLLVPPFIEGFLSYLREYLKELEVM